MADVIHGMPDAEYHAHPALSSSGAKLLLPPSCPRLFKWNRDNGQPPKRVFDVGHAAHAEVLGAGLEVEVVQKATRDKQVVDADDYATKSAQEHRDAIYAAGRVPLLHWELRQVREMAAALREHPLAAALLDPDHGRPEVSIFWRDDKHGIDRRARLDWLPDNDDDGVLTVPDYKTTASADPRAFARSIFKFRYDMQAVYYSDGILAAGLAADVEFRFVAQETTPPYLVTVHELDFSALAIGRVRVDEACGIYRECLETDTWPGYPPNVQLVSPPAWLADEYLELGA